MKKIFFLLILLFCYLTPAAIAQTNLLRQKIEQIVSQKKADVGVALYGFESKDTLSVNGGKHFPMQSVFKFHLALTVLNQVDKGKLSLNQKILIKKSDLSANTWSPLKKKYTNGNVRLPLSEILSYTVSQSDNNGCDILFKLVGGVKKVDAYMHGIGVKDIAIKATEGGMRKNWDVQFTNWTTPFAAVQMLQKFYNGKILSKSSYDFLWKIMTETSTGANRIKGELPARTLVAHKTGSSGVNEKGVTAAVNDIGIVTLPNGDHFALCVFVSNTKDNDAANEKTIADIAKAVWDFYTNKSK
jgi:beta-lactamase class A